MKTLLLGLLYTANIMASPRVGDYAVFEGLYEGMPLTIKGEYTAAQGTSLEQRNDFTLDGNTVTEFELIAETDIVTPENIQAVLDNCTGEGGTIEWVGTTAGTLKTCKITHLNLKRIHFHSPIMKLASDVLWVAKVPVFGVAKISQGGDAALEVKEYGWN